MCPVSARSFPFLLRHLPAVSSYAGPPWLQPPLHQHCRSLASALQSQLQAPLRMWSCPGMSASQLVDSGSGVPAQHTTLTLILHCKELMKCWKHSLEILVYVDMIASCSCCRFVGCTFTFLRTLLIDGDKRITTLFFK